MAKRLISDFFCVATAGPTADDRKIAEQWVDDIAATYSVNTYLARIWPEHMRWYGAYGEVVAVMRQAKKEGDKTLVQLFAQIAPDENLLYAIKRDKLLFPSIEVKENFAATGKAYLWGLGVTDQPASLRTDRLAFSQQCAGQGCTGQAPSIFTFEQTPINALNFKEVAQNTRYFDVGAWFLRKEPEAVPTPTEPTEESFTVTAEDQATIKQIVSEAFATLKTEVADAAAEKVEERFKQLEEKVTTFAADLKAFGEQEVVNHGARPETTGVADPDALPDDFC